MNTTPDTSAHTPPESPSTASSRWPSAVAGAAIGVLALTASVMGISAIVGAQDDSPPAAESAANTAVAIRDGLLSDDADTPDKADDVWIDADDEQWAAYDACLDSALGAVDFPNDESKMSEAAWEELEDQFELAEAECESTLPEDVKAEMAAWEPFDSCLDDQLSEVELDKMMELTDEQMADIDAKFSAAEEVCAAVLPAGAAAEYAAFVNFEQCLSDAGLSDETLDDGPVVHIDTMDGEQIIAFGEATGTVTITGTAAGITVETSDVTIVNSSDVEEALDTCEQLLPENLIEDWDDEDWDDEDWDDKDSDDEDREDEGRNEKN